MKEKARGQIFKVTWDHCYNVGEEGGRRGVKGRKKKGVRNRKIITQKNRDKE